MQYRYLLDPFNGKRTVYLSDQTGRDEVLFEFSPKDLDADDPQDTDAEYTGTEEPDTNDDKKKIIPSRLETLISLLTNQDPLTLAEQARSECSHEMISECDCLVDMPMSPLLAFHAINLHRKISRTTTGLPNLGKDRDDVLDRWFEQGIALIAAIPED